VEEDGAEAMIKTPPRQGTHMFLINRLGAILFGQDILYCIARSDTPLLEAQARTR
jgi:hypothetical protein